MQQVRHLYLSQFSGTYLNTPLFCEATVMRGHIRKDRCLHTSFFFKQDSTKTCWNINFTITCKQIFKKNVFGKCRICRELSSWASDIDLLLCRGKCLCIDIHVAVKTIECGFSVYSDKDNLCILIAKSKFCKWY